MVPYLFRYADFHEEGVGESHVSLVEEKKSGIEISKAARLFSCSEDGNVRSEKSVNDSRYVSACDKYCVIVYDRDGK